MTEIALVKTTDNELNEADREAMTRILFGYYIDAMGEADKSAWRKFWSKIRNLGAGEVIKVDFKFIRNGKFHRKFFALLNFAFEAWEPDRKHKTYKGMAVLKDFEQFRSDITIAAGFYEQVFNFKNEMMLKPKSISFAKMDDNDFEKVYSAVANVILEKVLTTYAGRDELDQVMDEVMRFLK